jgi:hypothetical protein
MKDRCLSFTNIALVPKWLLKFINPLLLSLLWYINIFILSLVYLNSYVFHIFPFFSDENGALYKILKKQLLQPVSYSFSQKEYIYCPKI